jgi:hypothetical protein
MAFSPGDLLLLQMQIPDTRDEVALWCDVKAVYAPAHESATLR